MPLPQPTGGSLRRPTLAALSALAVAGGVLSFGQMPSASASPHHRSTSTSTTTTTTVPDTVSSTLSSGLSTVTGLLSGVASDFSSAQTGWTPYGATTLTQLATVGHDAAGALSVTSAGAWTGAASPRFAVTPGARYTASSSVLAQSTGQSVGLALRFYDASGTIIKAGTQLGQGLTSSPTAWISTMPVVGFAPDGAVSADVVFVDYSGLAGDVQQVDDVQVSRTTGAGAPLATPLSTVGNKVVDRYGRTVNLRGVNVDGLEVTRYALISNRDIDEAHAWGANFVRIPLSQDMALPNSCGYDPSYYLSRIDGLVNEATQLGMIALLDLHTNALTACGASVQQKMPDQRSVDFWKTIASRYKKNANVAFDLYNEPHDVTDAVWRNGGTVTSNGITYTSPGMQALYNTVRGTGANNLVVASGNNWANTFPAGAPLTGTRNLVYGVHAYTCPQGTAETGHTCYPGPNGVFDPNGILNQWNTVQGSLPLMLTEFGYPDTNNGSYIANATSAVTARGWVGWSAFAFTGDTTGLWNLIKDTSSLNDPSIAGMAVVNALG